MAGNTHAIVLDLAISFFHYHGALLERQAPLPHYFLPGRWSRGGETYCAIPIGGLI